jgi:hypothetical protein
LTALGELLRFQELQPRGAMIQPMHRPVAAVEGSGGNPAGNGTVIAALREAMRASSPETFAVAEQSGALEEHLASVARGLAEDGLLQDGGIRPERLDEARARVLSIGTGALAEAMFAAQTLSDDPERWRDELEAWLPPSGPGQPHEEQAQRAARDGLGRALAAGRERLAARQGAGHDGQAALSTSRRFVVRELFAALTPAQILAHLFRQSSPEGYRYAAELGVLDAHVAAAVDALQGEGAVKDGRLRPDRVEDARRRVCQTDRGPVADALTARRILGDALELPAADLLARLFRESSPEGYRQAAELGVVERHIAAALDWLQSRGAIQDGRLRPDRIEEARRRVCQTDRGPIADAVAARDVLGDDADQTVAQVLVRLFQHASPEGYRNAAELGVVDEHIAVVVDSLQSNGGVEHGRLLPGRIEDARRRVCQTDGGPIAEVVTARRAFGEDPDRWRAELDRWLAATGAESYEEAARLKRLDRHLDVVVAAGRQRLQQLLDQGTPRAAALNGARRLMLQRSTPIKPGLVELAEQARAVRALAADDFATAEEIYRLGSPRDRLSLAMALMTAVMEVPSFGRLLGHQLFANAFGDGELFGLVLGAWHFGRGEVERAAAIFAALEKRTGSALAFQCHGNTRRCLGDYRAAGEIFERGMMVHPADRSLRIMAASVAFAQGDSARANSIFAPLRDEYFAQFPRQDYIASRRAELDEAIAQNLLYRAVETDVYDDKYAASTWWNYWYHFNAYNKHQHGEGILGEMVPECVNRALTALADPPRSFVELGAMCGEPLFRIAQDHPGISFFGVDRQRNVKDLNDAAYRLPNLTFVADDIFAFLHDVPEAAADAMLFHVRTAPFLYPAFLQKLYAECRAAGFRYVALLEVYTISYSQRMFRTFDEMPELAEIRGGGLIHHNYPRALANAGFRVIEQTIVPPTMLFTGIDNVVFIVAERTD